MLTHPTTERLRDLGLIGMARALEEMRRQPDSAALDFEERLALLVDRERLERDTKRLQTRLRFAGLRVQATPEDVDYRAARGLDRAVFQSLTGGVWIELMVPDSINKVNDGLEQRLEHIDLLAENMQLTTCLDVWVCHCIDLQLLPGIVECISYGHCQVHNSVDDGLK